MIWVNISENCKSVPCGRVVLRRCSCCLGPAVWSWAPQTVRWHWFPSFVPTVKAGDISGTVTLKVLRSLGLLHQHEKALRTSWEKMWKAHESAPNCQSQRHQSPHHNNNLSSTHIFKEAETLEREPAWIRAGWALFHSLDLHSSCGLDWQWPGSCEVSQWFVTLKAQP